MGIIFEGYSLLECGTILAHFLLSLVHSTKIWGYFYQKASFPMGGVCNGFQKYPFSTFIFIPIIYYCWLFLLCVNQWWPRFKTLDARLSNSRSFGTPNYSELWPMMGQRF